MFHLSIRFDTNRFDYYWRSMNLYLHLNFYAQSHFPLCLAGHRHSPHNSHTKSYFCYYFLSHHLWWCSTWTVIAVFIRMVSIHWRLWLWLWLLVADWEEHQTPSKQPDEMKKQRVQQSRALSSIAKLSFSRPFFRVPFIFRSRTAHTVSDECHCAMCVRRRRPRTDSSDYRRSHRAQNAVAVHSIVSLLSAPLYLSLRWLRADGCNSTDDTGIVCHPP